MFLRSRDRFLGSSSVLTLDPRDPDGEDQNDVVAQDDDVSGDDDAGADDQTDDESAEGEEDGGDDNDDAEASGEKDEDDEEVDLESLPPDVRRKVEKAIEAKLKKETAWRDKQISKLHTRNRNAAEDNKALKKIAESLPANATEEQIAQAAAQLTAQQRYDEDTRMLDANGRKEYKGKWGPALDQLKNMGGIDVQDMIGINATDAPHTVLYAIATDNELYERLTALPPAKRQTEFVKLSLKAAPKQGKSSSGAPSRAAPPVTPVSGTRATAAKKVNLLDDKVSDEDWYRARNAQRRKKFTHVE